MSFCLHIAITSRHFFRCHHSGDGGGVPYSDGDLPNKTDCRKRAKHPDCLLVSTCRLERCFLS